MIVYSTNMNANRTNDPMKATTEHG